MTLSHPKLVTADELLAMGDIGRCELIYGELHMMSPAGAEHGVIAMRMAGHLFNFAETSNLGTCFAAETGFLVSTDPDLVRAPDASFIAAANLRPLMPKGYYPGVPDLAIEVVSPTDTRREVAEKINMWLAAGTSVVWEVRTSDRTVLVHRAGIPAKSLGIGDDLTDEPLLPGFKLPLSAIFKFPG